jgi:formylglycine-generating enzyme required for sulfatase activity
MASVFLCHASEDKHVVEPMQLALASAGYKVFYDELSLPPGGDYHARIRLAIRQCDIFVFIGSKSSIAAGKYTLTELKFARERWASPVKHVLPVSIGGTSPSDFPAYLQAATVLVASGNAAAEVRAAVEGMLANARPSLLKLGLAAIAIAGMAAALVAAYLSQTPPPVSVPVAESVSTPSRGLEPQQRSDPSVTARPPPSHTSAAPGSAAQAAAPSPGARASQAPISAPSPLAGERPQAVRKPGSVFQECAACPELIVVPTGTFVMGSSSEHDPNRAASSPPHTVRIAYPLAVGKSETTVQEFARFAKSTGYVTDAERGAGCRSSTETDVLVRKDRSWRDPGFKQSATEPVVCVSWNDAQAYVQWLNSTAGGTGYRLLSEAEWEYVARAGTANTRFPWGDDVAFTDVCAHANVGDYSAVKDVPRFSSASWASCGDSFPYTAPAHVFKNPFGLHNVIGNVWEWVEDPWHPTYAGAPTNGSIWTAGGDPVGRVFRGGSWANHPVFLSASNRGRAGPAFSEEAIGFRLAKSL